VFILFPSLVDIIFCQKLEDEEKLSRLVVGELPHVIDRCLVGGDINQPSAFSLKHLDSNPFPAVHFNRRPPSYLGQSLVCWNLSSGSS